MARGIVLILAAVCLEAQNAELVRMTGRVLSVAGEPLSGARVRLSGAEANLSYIVETGESGAFVFDSLAPGRYRLEAQRNGYVPARYRDPVSRSFEVELAPARGVSGLELRLTPEAVIAGRVMDEAGEPFAGARVEAYQWSYVSWPGRRQLQTVAVTVAGADGAFSLGGLAEGAYYLSAQDPRERQIAPGIEARGNGEPERRYLLTFFPSAQDVDGAQPVFVRGGARFPVADIRMRRTPVFRIWGRVIDGATGAPVAEAVVLHHPADPRLDLRARLRTSRGLGTGGVFTLDAVPPGRHVVQVTAGGVTTREVVTVADRDVEITLRTSPGVEVRGRIGWEGPVPAALPPTVALRLASWLPAAAPSARPAADGSFRLERVSPGDYELVVAPLPPEAYVKSVQLDGREVRGQLLTLTGNAELRITLSAKAGSIGGVVRDASGRAAAGVFVTAWRPGAGTTEWRELPLVTQSGPDGRFEFTGVEPGEFRVQAWEEIEPGLFLYRPFIEQFAATAARVGVEEGAPATVTPGWAGAAAIGAAASRAR